MPVIRRLLVEDATDAGLLVAVCDAAGRLLWVEGEHRAAHAAEQMHFVAGAGWNEAHAGTNAPGTALALDHAVQIFGAEHLPRTVTPWSCSAAPIHDPDTGALLGALDLTGGDDVAAPHTWPWSGPPSRRSRPSCSVLQARPRDRRSRTPSARTAPATYTGWSVLGRTHRHAAASDGARPGSACGTASSCCCSPATRTG